MSKRGPGTDTQLKKCRISEKRQLCMRNREAETFPKFSQKAAAVFSPGGDNVDLIAYKDKC